MCASTLKLLLKENIYKKILQIILITLGKSTKSLRIARSKGNYFQTIFSTSRDHKRETSNLLEDEQLISTLPSFSFPCCSPRMTYLVGEIGKETEYAYFTSSAHILCFSHKQRVQVPPKRELKSGDLVGKSNVLVS